MPKRKEFPVEKKLEVIAQALAADDLRTVLTEGLHRRHVLAISNWGLSDGRITEADYEAIVDKIERPREFPADPEQRLEALLSVGNTEPKQVLSLLLSDKSQSVETLRKQFIATISGVQYKGQQWRPQVSTIDDYSVRSLDLIGFIAFPLIRTTTIGYARTQAGKLYGQPVMAFMLNMTNHLGFSMHQLLGHTATRGDSRAPYNRFRILEYILRQRYGGEVTREADIVELLNLDHTCVRDHLNALKEVGIVEWDSIGPERSGQIMYRWNKGKNPKEVPTYRTEKRLTPDVVAYLARHMESNNLGIIEHLMKKKSYKGWKYKSLLSKVSGILSHLEKCGFAQADYKGGAVFSHVNLVQDWTNFVEEFTRKLRESVTGGPELKAMEQLYRDYMANFDRFQHDATRAVGFYVDVSPRLNQQSAQEAQRCISTYIGVRGEARPKDMKKDLGFNVIPQLSNMVANGVLVVRREGSKAFYSRNPNYRP